MERSVAAQIIDTLHLMLRVILGIGMMYAALATAGFIALYILLSTSFSSKYGPVYEEPIFWPMLVLLGGTLPSAVAACILIFKNRLVFRNPRETAFAAANILSVFLFYHLSPNIEDPNGTLIDLLVLVSTALLYCLSAVMIIIVARKERMPTSVKSGSHLIR